MRGRSGLEGGERASRGRSYSAFLEKPQASLPDPESGERTCSELQGGCPDKEGEAEG